MSDRLLKNIHMFSLAPQQHHLYILPVYYLIYIYN